MSLNALKGLEYRGELVGIRMTTNSGDSWDVGKDVMKEWGMKHFNIEERLELKLHGDLLLSDEEVDTGNHSLDISTNNEIMDSVKQLLTGPLSGRIKGFQMPWKMSLNEFYMDEGWVPVKVDRTDEYKNQHYMYMPDGSKWSGGWIGKSPSLEKAKLSFHKKQVYYALHRGANVSDVALDTYPALKEAKHCILEIQNRVRISGDTMTVDMNGRQQSFHACDYFNLPRYAQRGFVKDNDLVSPELNNIDEWFSAVEMTCIALIRAVSIVD
jgi:hypothetical protein